MGPGAYSFWTEAFHQGRHLSCWNDTPGDRSTWESGIFVGSWFKQPELM